MQITLTTLITLRDTKQDSQPTPQTRWTNPVCNARTHGDAQTSQRQ